MEINSYSNISKYTLRSETGTLNVKFDENNSKWIIYFCDLNFYITRFLATYPVSGKFTVN